ncbi:bifunctional acetate--CoA ligase family protein/GNAT family N-acetyltransferase [Piscinibacter sp. HJYY11]|uniref:bifunctional acetate--CoA ligase family protein/GNAT family N-acetyltransferase n=1 Tax=Piscinibacter sp. HJYY11 TaxID=2801333 RepID=UPI00191C9EF2|nr:bifunctional acetate--CoA ligase family protein/GNAT family N-acetyltransferase [Piscinibacter sp. HJYY11]MBL0726585.1 bifunctional acetate--CoA ligase family protein/GNAT family N-acetyltransferase [Piscinibacter sp. HJYY11]
MSIRHLDLLLTPKSVAVIGASERPGSVGATVWRNLRSGAFAGPVWPVNLKHRTLGNAPVFDSVGDLPAAPDLAVICTPARTVPGLIEALGRLGTRAAIVMTAGIDGETRAAMLSKAKPYLLRVLGPNCLGLLSPHIGLNASFAHIDARAGDLAFVSQSGALVTAVLDWARPRGIGFSHMISLGEHADVDFGDLLDHLASDPHTRSILLYIESIESPRKFMSAARAAARNKPVVVVKAGRGAKGAAAAASHTGALAGSDLVYDAAIRRAGMLRVFNLADLFVAAETLTRFGRNRDTALTIMTNGGGAGVMAADAAEAAGVPLVELSPAVLATLDQALPATWSRRNPVDIIGDAPAQRYVDTLNALLAQRDTGAILFIHAPTAIVRSDDIAQACLPIAKGASGRLLSCWLGDDAVRPARRLFEEAGIADYATPEQAVNAFAMLATYWQNQALLLEAPAAGKPGEPALARARAIVSQAIGSSQLLLDEASAKALLSAYGIATVETVAVAPEAQAAVDAASRLGYPVALKILSPDISHKSDAGGVRLGLHDADELRDAAQRMLDTLRARQPRARIEGFTVQPMVARPQAQELIVGASVDPVFGPVILFGHGGTAVEVVADRALALPPLNRVLARDLISRTRVSRLLASYRDRPPADLDAVCDVLIAVSRMLADLPEIAELDINPIWADASGAIALDARVRLSPTPVAGASRFAIAPYPDGLAQAVSWRGHPIQLRPIKPEDAELHSEFVARLTPEDLRLRFFSARRELSPSELARLTQIDYDREMAFIAFEPDGVRPEILGVARAACDPDNVDAELGVIVRSDLKGQGLGTLLLDKLVAHLTARGTQRLVAIVLRDNSAMRDLALERGFVADRTWSDPGTLRLVLPLQPVSASV